MRSRRWLMRRILPLTQRRLRLVRIFRRIDSVERVPNFFLPWEYARGLFFFLLFFFSWIVVDVLRQSVVVFAKEGFQVGLLLDFGSAPPSA